MPVLPADFDPLHWQETPPDQWLPSPPARGSRLTLSGFGGMFGAEYTCELPWLDLRMDTLFKGQWTSAGMRAQVVRVDTDLQRVSITYCGSMPILAAANDVLVKESIIELRDRSGFAVAAQDLETYHDRARAAP